MIEQGSEREVTNITLDIWDKNKFDPEEHHFIFLTEQLIREETYSKGDQKIWIEAASWFGCFRWSTEPGGLHQ
ncbi:hypothetical protein ACFQKF_11870 [Halalkalicoccus sp. GCM10025322]|uniref:hypothetical protein n=1 Tax=Halalkalicoccus TaxID=332246 RepID=UPI002F966576